MAPVPWRNGGGTTRPLAGAPDGAWRLSVATVERPGPFSDLTGQRRVLVVADGLLELVVQGAPHRLAPGDAVAFDGGAPVSAAPHGGPVTVVNAMAAAPGRPRVRVRTLGGPGEDGGGALAGEAAAVVLLRGSARVGDERLDALDAALGPLRVDDLLGGARVVVVESWTGGGAG